MITTELCEFSDVQPIWRSELWPDRKSVIESHSAMQWPYGDDLPEYNPDVYSFTPSFVCVRDGPDIVAVNSGHLTTPDYYRTRGIWVHEDFRNEGIAGKTYDHLLQIAQSENAIMMWCIPRSTSLSMHQRWGFSQVGQAIVTETSDQNYYVYRWI